MYKRISKRKINDNNILFDGKSLNKKISTIDNRLKTLAGIYNDLIWIHANPSNDDVVNDANEKYIENSQRIDFMNNLEDYIVNDSVRLVLLEGKRGSGKTFLQNYFLNIHMPKINNTTWFRVDITKIYNYNSENASKYVDFEQYLWAQIVFVFFRYCKIFIDKGVTYGFDTHFKGICTDAIFNKISMSELEKKQFINDIEIIPHNHNSIDGKPFHHSDTKQIALNILKALSVNKIKVVLFIDGIDNVSLADNKYIECKKTVNQFIINYLKNKNSGDYQYFSKIIFSSREELDIRVSLFDTMQKLNAYKAVSKNLHIENISIDDLIEKVINYAKLKKLVLPKSLEKDLKCIIREISENISINSETAEIKFIVDIFDGDCREAFYALITTYFFVKNHLSNVKNYGKKIDSIYEFFDENGQFKAKVIEELKAVLIEGLFKNGCFYTPDIKTVQYSPPYRGLGFTNIFNPAFYYTLDYNPLVSLYLLKYLNTKGGEVLYTRLLEKCLEYKLCIEKYGTYNAIQVLIEYNYLELHEKNIKITAKGKIVYKMVLSNLDIFSSNIYNALQEMSKPLNIDVYETVGRKYRIVQLKNSIIYINFLHKIQDKLIDSLDVKSDFIQNIKINFIESLSRPFLNIFIQSPYVYEDIISSLDEKEIETFDKLLYMPENYNDCNQKVQNINNRILYKSLNAFLNDIAIPDTLTSLMLPKREIDLYEVKVIFVYRIFEKRKRYNAKEDPIDDFLFDIEDSNKLQQIVNSDNLGLDKIELVLKEYHENISQHVDVWIYISELLSKFCNNIGSVVKGG